MARKDRRAVAPTTVVPGANTTYGRIYDVVRRIPRGRVATYGQVAELAGLSGRARQVGYALHALSEHSAVPWHRVVNSAGGISRRGIPGPELVQRQRLEREGVTFSARGRIDFAAFRWRT